MACCCFGVVTVMTLKPDCESTDSLLEAAPGPVAVLWHPDISARTAMALAILVSANSFFICFLLSGLVDFWLYEKLEVNSRRKSSSTPPEPATTTEATAAESSAATPAIAAAALKVLEALALLTTTRPILCFAVQILHLRTGSVVATATRSIVAASGTIIAAFGSIGAARRRRSLLVTLR